MLIKKLHQQVICSHSVYLDTASERRNEETGDGLAAWRWVRYRFRH